jgi:hypothetical protein
MGLIFEAQRTPLGRQGVMLQVKDAKVVFIDWACIGPPEVFLSEHPFYAGSKVLRKGPSYRD